ncbi:toxin-antitoxin system protein [Streptococcus acidominimus]|uniref:toxin-antitoxin system protein n=1 Tax=Streptococcus acidominimus TaxID=1326 RepID=UPI0018841445|nr:toxin-antitoxin system protein [Streptococcus acidominimus]MBF0817851.1 toxin-antitoxin system protein [Streptococcus acidominimus]MBF0838367.1 toxin-antitoxin system protein [Streptococcus acidominimus]MBF0846270.1 toxin-antitoxin system protein [Streptococcus danieliae]
MATKVFSKRVDSDLLDKVSDLYASLGTSTQEAFIMFLRKSLEVQGLPFELRKKIDITEFDEKGIYITEERLVRAKQSIAELDNAKAVDFNINNQEHVAWLFED